MQLLKCLFILVLFVPSIVHSVEISEIQEVRLAKAELALLDGKEKKALGFINKNLSAKNFHLETFIFLGKYHLSKGKLTKSMKVFYYLIRKLHTSLLTDSYFDYTFLDKLQDAPVPSKKALEVYYMIALNYYNVYGEGIYNKKFNQSILYLAQKYFTISRYYQYNLALSNFYLAQIHSKENNTQDAVKRFVEARELFQEDTTVKPEQINQLDVLLGEALIRDGLNDAGSMFLKSVYLNPDSNASLKQYANSYLDALGDSYAAVTVSLTSKYDSNLHDLNDAELADFDNSYKESLNSTSGLTMARTLNIFYSKKIAKNWSNITVFNFLDEVAADSKLKMKDVRSYSLGLDFKYDNLIKSAAKIKYNFSQIYLRDTAESKLEKSTTTHSITPQYIHSLKRGTITWGVPYEHTTQPDSTTQTKLGLSVSYSPYFSSKWISPTTNFEFSNAGEEAGAANSKVIEGSVSNHSLLSDSHSFFSSLSFTKNSNADPDLDYLEYDLDITYNFLIPFLKELYGSVTIERIDRSQSSSEHTASWLLNTGLSYTF